jgi:hypothetical protein
VNLKLAGGRDKGKEREGGETMCLFATVLANIPGLGRFRGQSPTNNVRSFAGALRPGPTLSGGMPDGLGSFILVHIVVDARVVALFPIRWVVIG